MKNLALIAAVAAISIPAAANAAETMERNWYDGASTMNFTVQQGEIYNSAPFIPADGQTMTVALKNGGKLMLDGKAAYIISESGNKFLFILIKGFEGRSVLHISVPVLETATNSSALTIDGERFFTIF